MIVVDTNVVAYLLMNGEHTAAAERLMLEDGDWAAPLLWRSEFRNILATQVRSKGLDLGIARRVMAAAEDILRGREFAVRSDAVLAAAASSGCTAYDCEFVVLAGDLGVALVTSDRKVLSAFPGTALPLREEG